jgi:hypothetical protein
MTKRSRNWCGRSSMQWRGPCWGGIRALGSGRQAYHAIGVSPSPTDFIAVQRLVPLRSGAQALLDALIVPYTVMHQQPTTAD